MFDQLETEARAGYDRIIELDLDVVAIDGSLHKAPCGGEGTGKSPVDRAKLGWKWSVASSAPGSRSAGRSTAPTATTSDMLEPTLDAIADNGLLADIGTLTLIAATTTPRSATSSTPAGSSSLDIQRRGTKPPPGSPHRLTLGLRWIVEATNTWWSNYGQLRRSTDRKIRHRHAALQLATVVLIVGRLIDYRNRWSPT